MTNVSKVSHHFFTSEHFPEAFHYFLRKHCTYFFIS